MKTIKILLSIVISCLLFQESNAQAIDIQAHRGGMALYPENTIEAMLNALDWGVNTLEMDLGVSKDKKVIVTHDLYMDHRYMTTPEGNTIQKKNEKKIRIYKMNYDSIVQYNSGLIGDPRFEQRSKISTHKPLLSDLLDATEAYAKANGIPLPHYNIEIKSSEKNDNAFSPPYKEFTDLVMEVILSKGITERINIQCFDIRTLKYLHEKYPQIKLAYLISKEMVDFEANMSRLDFVPEIYSPHFSLVDKKLIKAVHKKGMTILPWTVDKHEDIQRMVDLKVDGLITNYPDRAVKLVKFTTKEKKNYLYPKK